jgi:hypothetical protein
MQWMQEDGQLHQRAVMSTSGLCERKDVAGWERSCRLLRSLSPPP